VRPRCVATIINSIYSNNVCSERFGTALHHPTDCSWPSNMDNNIDSGCWYLLIRYRLSGLQPELGYGKLVCDLHKQLQRSSITCHEHGLLWFAKSSKYWGHLDRLKSYRESIWFRGELYYRSWFQVGVDQLFARRYYAKFSIRLPLARYWVSPSCKYLLNT